jgi:hypothetical protein
MSKHEIGAQAQRAAALAVKHNHMLSAFELNRGVLTAICSICGAGVKCNEREIWGQAAYHPCKVQFRTDSQTGKRTANLDVILDTCHKR